MSGTKQAPIYRGPLDINKMSPLTRRAYQVYNGQKARCTNPNNQAHKNYGAKGVCVEYEAREFIAWWTKQFKSKRWIRPCVGRLDHNKNYSFDNIEMQETSANSKERNSRHGNPSLKKPVVVEVYFDTMGDACKYFGVSRKTVYNHCNRRTKAYFKFGPNAGKKVHFKWA